MPLRIERRAPFGAEPFKGGARFRVWAPACRSVEVVCEAGARPLEAEAGGFFSGAFEGLRAGDRYRLRLDDGALVPDPASRFQPEGPHGPSQLVDPEAFPWRDARWEGPALKGCVLYELHVGTFTPEGSWDAAARRLPELARLGVTAVEIMPVAEVPGRFNWGYDGVCLFAPSRNYGEPDDFRRFVDAAHGLGLAAILDVVYNHLGPDGNYLARLAPPVFSARHKTDWGQALNFDGPDSGPVRELVLASAEHWIGEYHLDGLRVDATQNIHDDSPRPIFAELARRARAAAGGRRVLLFAENEPQQPRFVAPEDSGGFGFDGLWNDDFHHAFRVALTGRRRAYFADYSGAPQQLLSAVKRGYLYQGQHYPWQNKRRGEPARGVPAEAFVTYLENHDQVANSTAAGRRLVELTSPGRLRAATALWLLSPGTPMLFQGQERGARQPFVFFADHRGELGRAVARGRRELMRQLPERAPVPDPCDEATFRGCVLSDGGPVEADAWRALHADLLALRRSLPAVAAQDAGLLDGAVLGPQALCLRWHGRAPADDRLLLVNLGADRELEDPGEPLLAPPAGMGWTSVWTSLEPRYGGPGARPFDERRWSLDAESARLLEPREEKRHGAS